MDLESLDQEITLWHKISVADASSHVSHPQYNDGKESHHPVSNLQIPVKLFLLWSAKRILQERLCTSVCKHYERVCTCSACRCT